MELSEFDIEYHPRGAIKGQAVVDFINEYTYAPGEETEMQEEQPEKEEADQVKWVIYVDGSSTNSTVKGGVVLVTPEGNKLEYTIRFGFKVTNNEAEYDAMLTRLRLTHALEAKRVRVNSYS